MPLSYFDRTADAGAIVEALRRDGAVAVTDLADGNTAVGNPARLKIAARQF